MRSLPVQRPFRFRLAEKLFHQVDNSQLVLFRIVFGFLLFYHCMDFILSGYVYDNLIQPPFNFTYIGFEFLQVLHGQVMYIYFGLMALLALMIMAGAWYRFAMIGFTVLWTCVYLSQKLSYNNHYYLILLLCLLMSFMPANRYRSIDVKRKAIAVKRFCPRWISWLFITQTAIIYFFAGISKFSPDWLSGKFIALQFAKPSMHRFIGPIYGSKEFQLFICYGGIAFDLIIVPLLLWKRTRLAAFFVYCGFHLFNSYTFHIGIFPYLSIAMAIFFWEPEKIRGLFFKKKELISQTNNDPAEKTFRKQLVLYTLSVYLLLQLLLPMRSWFYPGNTLWTEEGYEMSWKMMLRFKTGTIHFKVVDTASHQLWNVYPADKFTKFQVSCIAIYPDMVWMYTQRIKKEFAGKGYPGVEIFAIDSVSLNKNPPQLLIDTNADLAKIKWEPFLHSKWVIPYKKRLP